MGFGEFPATSSSEALRDRALGRPAGRYGPVTDRQGLPRPARVSAATSSGAMAKLISCISNLLSRTISGSGMGGRPSASPGALASPLTNLAGLAEESLHHLLYR